MDESGERRAFLEVALGDGAKLVVMGSSGRVSLRLRAVRDGIWSFLTPALSLARADVERLLAELGQTKGIPLVLEHPAMEGKFNLLRYGGRIHVHFEESQSSGSERELAKALAEALGA